MGNSYGVGGGDAAGGASKTVADLSRCQRRHVDQDERQKLEGVGGGTWPLSL